MSVWQCADRRGRAGNAAVAPAPRVKRARGRKTSKGASAGAGPELQGKLDEAREEIPTGHYYIGCSESHARSDSVPVLDRRCPSRSRRSKSVDADTPSVGPNVTPLAGAAEELGVDNPVPQPVVKLGQRQRHA